LKFNPVQSDNGEGREDSVSGGYVKRIWKLILSYGGRTVLYLVTLEITRKIHTMFSQVF